MDLDEDVSSICESAVSIARNAFDCNRIVCVHTRCDANLNECFVDFSQAEKMNPNLTK